MKDLIYDHIKKEGLERVIAQEIANLFNIKRSVASHYLNRLVDEKKLLKGQTRPIEFRLNDQSNTKGIFTDFIGFDGSMKQQIEQCKAAVTYPPNGLPLIIRGNSGVGKSFLANLIYNYAKGAMMIDQTAPFVVLNCADYANNSELLSSILFGYKKGAFTGAEQEQEGLLAKAHGGVLFLDEIHNLSSENQEKLFLLIDSQKYRKLGENDKWEHADVRLILATTEDIQQSLLATFRRRIPLEIKLPDYSERNVLERTNLVFSFFKSEVITLKTTIAVDEEIIKSLIHSTFEGNIGEIKNKIKVYCAESYNKKKVGDAIIYIAGDGSPHKDELMTYFPFNTLEDHQKLTESNFPPELLSFYQGKTFKEIEHSLDDYLQLIKEKVANPLNEPLFTVQNEHWLFLEGIKRNGRYLLSNAGLALTDKEWDTLGKVALSIYLNEGINYVKLTVSIQEKKKYHKYFYLAQEIIQASLDISSQATWELLVAVMAAYLKRVTPIQTKKNALILMHGDQNASSIAQVANKLLTDYVYTPFDMAIEVNTDDMIRRVSDYVKKIDTTSGIVILVDMGSLERMYEELKDIVTGDLIIISNVSTALAIDIGFKLTQQMEMEELVAVPLNPFYPTVQYYEGLSPKQNILISCVSGEGIAVKIKDIISHYIDESQVDILTMDYHDLASKLAENNRGTFTNTLAVLTTSNLVSAMVPLINIEQIVNGGATLEVLNDLIELSSVKDCTNEIIKLFTLEGASAKLTFLNPEMIINEVEEIISGYERHYGIEFQHFLRMNLFLHFSTMIERILVGDQVEEDAFSVSVEEQAAFDDFVRLSNDIAKKILKKYNIVIPVSEYALVYHIINQISKNTLA